MPTNAKERSLLLLGSEAHPVLMRANLALGQERAGLVWQLLHQRRCSPFSP